MRIFLFPKMILTEETQVHSLKNCSVVIDGQNFLHYMYEKSKIPFVFGCETNKYAEYLKEQFKMFEQANVKCYIVLKGGDTDIEKKIKKFQHLFYDFHTNVEFVAPVILKDVNTQVLDEMGVNYAYCVAESKDDCVALAQKLECPIISFDIEYCFRKAPYIPSVSLTFNSINNSIHCRQYKLQNFLQKNSLTDEKTALFATLTDTTVFPVNFFDKLFLKWRVLNKDQSKQLRNLIHWLRQYTNGQAWNDIKRFLNYDNHKKFMLNYNNILINMRNENVGHVTKYLLNSSLPIVQLDPEWFKKGVICKHVPKVYINLYKHKIIEGSWDIPDKTSDDSLLLSIDIIKYAYNLLTNYKRNTIKLYQDADNFVEIDTVDINVGKPDYNCSVSVFENGWNEVKNMKLFEHFLTENKINTDILVNAELPAECVLMLIALVYFARKKQLKGEHVTKEVYAVVLSYVVLNLLSNKDAEDYLKVKSITEKYYHYDKLEARRIFDGNVLKSFVELQYCIKHMNYLNTLCGAPFQPSQYRRIYNGTFVFKIFCEMKDKDGDHFVNKLFQSVPKVLAVFEGLIKVYRRLMSTE